MPNLPPERRQAIADELRFHQQLEDRAALDKYVRVSFAYDAGMTTREIGVVMDVTSGTASRWKDWGEQERARRRREDPGRPGELGAVS
jgi:hypothetical protein